MFNDRKKIEKSKIDFDILNIMNNSNNFENFTPYKIANEMISNIPDKVFKNPNYRFLDPSVKSGIFLREIVYKLITHLPNIKHIDSITGKVYDLSKPKERINHILRNMIYGIAISELTGYITRRTIYGVMEADINKDDEYLINKIKANKNDIEEDVNFLEFNTYFDNKLFSTIDRAGYEKEGNIFYPKDYVSIEDEDNYSPFIEETDHKFINLIKNGLIKFDVIISNPKYDININKSNSQFKYIYNEFVEKSIKLKPKYLMMIMPARWFTSSIGLAKFRLNMIKDKRIKKFVYYKNSKDCFKNLNLRGGICYFLWESRYNGNCYFDDGNKTTLRSLSDFKDVIISDNYAIDILSKINYRNNLSSIFSQINPFKIPINFKNFEIYESEENLRIYAHKKVSYINKKNVNTDDEKIDKYKVLIPRLSDGKTSGKSIVLGRPIVSPPNSICTYTYLIAGVFETEIEAKNYAQYLKTKFVRYLIGTLKNTQDLSRQKVKFVPIQNFKEIWNDEKLYKKYKLTKEEIEHIESSIKRLE